MIKAHYTHSDQMLPAATTGNDTKKQYGGNLMVEAMRLAPDEIVITGHKYELISTGGTRDKFSTLDPLPLGVLQALVGGYIELLSPEWTHDLITEEHRAYCNEEGRLVELKPNRFIGGNPLFAVQHVVGNVLIEYAPFPEENEE